MGDSLKNFRAVREIKAEALGLITHPADRLVIDRDSEVPPRKSLTVVLPPDIPPPGRTCNRDVHVLSVDRTLWRVIHRSTIGTCAR